MNTIDKALQQLYPQLCVAAVTINVSTKVGESGYFLVHNSMETPMRIHLVIYSLLYLAEIIIELQS